jgi:trans-AT polyketide synthase/acyltransferase/oxidoreductase domain-containing protein
MKVQERTVYQGQELTDVVARVRETVHIVFTPDGGVGAVLGDPGGLDVLATLPPLYPEWLGDRRFCEVHGTRFPYVAGEMANGIATPQYVIAMAQAGMIGFYGAAGVPLPKVETVVQHLGSVLAGRPNWGVNLIHSPQDPAQEDRMADLLIAGRVPAVSVSAFMDLTPAVVRLAATGLRVSDSGQIVRARQILAKVSRPEVAALFMAPPPEAVVAELRARGRLTATEAALALRIPVAPDITVEADSGGHTDNRPLVSLLPRIIALRDRLDNLYDHGQEVRIGAAGGLGTPHAVAAAFAAGAAYVLTGTVNQTCIEAGISADAKALLARADIADVIMAPAADMFELGVTVQVLRRGVMFGPRAKQLYQAYRDYESLEAIPAQARWRLERSVLGATIEEIWSQTRTYWLQRDPVQIARAQSDPKHRMALVFRWYLGQSSNWAITGEVSRRADYQVWCGPAIGAFNQWVEASFLAEPANRTVVQVALNLMEGAAVLTRAHQLRTFGVPVPAAAFRFVPRYLA